MKQGLWVAAILAAVATPAVAQNIIANPDFETGVLDPWFQQLDFGGPENWNVTNADAHTGTYSATACGNKRLRQEFTPTDTASITEVSCWIRNMKADTYGINAYDLIYSDGPTFEIQFTPPDTDWHYIDLTPYLAPGQHLRAVAVWGFVAHGTLDERTFVDDWIVNVGSTCAADFNGDGFLDPLDYNGFINAFEAGDMSADFNGDGFLDPLDYNGYINAFEAGC